MNRILASLSTLMLCAAATAQCYESNFGTLLGVGDDTAFPSTNASNALGFTFPIGASNYTHYTVNTNGVVYLHTAATGISGASFTGYDASAATMLANLRGAAGDSPRLAAYWSDLDLVPANGGGLYYNNLATGRGVFTWKNAVQWGLSEPVFTVQMQVFANGEVWMFYNGNAQTAVPCPMVGVSKGGAIADAGISDLSIGATGVSVSPIVYQSFPTQNTFDLQNRTIKFVPNVGGGYNVSPTLCEPANNTSYGAGCGKLSATVYEAFEQPNTFDLSNTSVRLTPTGTGYLFTPGTGTNYTHTVAGLALGDDDVGTLALPTPFNYPGGSTSTLTICSNGYIWMQSPNRAIDFSPTATELFSNAARLMPMWCDAVPDGLRNMANVFAQVDTLNNKAYVSWLNIPIRGGGAMNVQCELDLTSGAVEYRYGAISCGNAAIVGWTPGRGPSAVDAGSIDFSARLAAGFQTRSPEQGALSLATATNPVIGSTMTFTTDQIPATGLTFYLLSAGQYNPGLDLGVIGAPGCQAYITLPEILSSLQIGTPTATTSVTIPNDPFFAGIAIYSQAVAVDPSANAFGFITSNGIRSYLNAF